MANFKWRKSSRDNVIKKFAQCYCKCLPTINNWKNFGSHFSFFRTFAQIPKAHTMCFYVFFSIFYSLVSDEKNLCAIFHRCFRWKKKTETWATLLMYYSHLKRYRALLYVRLEPKGNVTWNEYIFKYIFMYIFLSQHDELRIELLPRKKGNKFKFIHSEAFPCPSASNIKFVEEEFRRINLMEMCVHDVIHKNIYAHIIATHSTSLLNSYMRWVRDNRLNRRHHDEMAGKWWISYMKRKWI